MSTKPSPLKSPGMWVGVGVGVSVGVLVGVGVGVDVGQAPSRLVKLAILLVITGSTPFCATVTAFGTAAHGAPTITCTVMENVAGTALLNDPLDTHTTAPAAPTAGVVQVNAGPPVCTADTNVVFG